MDVLVLIDKLDDLVHNAKPVPLTDQVRIDREEIYEILDQMRATIPEEIKQARWIVKERQEMLAEAKREVDRMLGEAREQAAREASQTEIVRLAEQQAQEIVEDAQRKARETRLEMEDWADGILSTLEVNLERFLTAVKRGRERLHERSRESVVAGMRADTDGGAEAGIPAAASASSLLTEARWTRPSRSRASATRSAMPTGRSPRTSCGGCSTPAASPAARRTASRGASSSPSSRGARAARRRRLRAPTCAALRSAIAVLGKRNFDTGRAAQNLMLAAWNEGVASSPNGIADAAAAEELLGGEVAIVLSLGYPARPRDPRIARAEEWSARANRRPLDELVLPHL